MYEVNVRGLRLLANFSILFIMRMLAFSHSQAVTFDA